MVRENYLDLLTELDDIQTSLEKRLNSVSDTPINYNSKLIELMAQYPQFKEIIEFILEVNDATENKNRQNHAIYEETIRRIIKVKLELVDLIVRGNEKKTEVSTLEKIKNFLSTKDTKYQFFLAITIILCISLYFQPDTTLSILKELKDIFLKIGR